MSRLSEFFRESHTAFGVFYPLHCFVAVFDEHDTAQEVEHELERSGVDAQDFAVVEGREFVAFEEEETHGVRKFMQRFSRRFGTEQMSTDRNLEHARNGAVIVLVHCESSAEKRAAWSVLKEHKPRLAHYYDRIGVEHLVGPVCGRAE